MAMNRYGYLDYKKLEVGDQVSWEHPVTGKVYDFEVTDADWNDVWQPLELQLLDDPERGKKACQFQRKQLIWASKVIQLLRASQA